jgi:hypothetical protein
MISLEETKPDFSGMASLKEIFLLGDTIYKTLQDCTGLQNDSNLTIYVKKSLYDKVKGHLSQRSLEEAVHLT